MNKLHKKEWNHYSEDEKTAAKNTFLLADLLYSMCQVNLINKGELENSMCQVVNLKGELENSMNTIKKAINKAIQDSNQILKEIN